LTRSVRLRAFAKINLGLKILGPRHDGYHEIRTVCQTLTLHDRLEICFTRRPGISVRCTDASIPSGRGNLVYLACDLWRKKNNFAGGIEAALEKRIPIGSGLGGGSSDAAATLIGLERLAGRASDFYSLFPIAAKLGSDVPLFLLGGRVLSCGRGEEVYPLADLPRRRCLLIYPGFRISTEEAYRKVDRELTTSKENRKVGVFGVWSQFPTERWGPAENSFEKAVFAKWPELGRLKGQLIRAGAETASLTGSGSAVYAIVESFSQLNHASEHIPHGWTVFRTQSLTRAQYWRRVVEA
jgi:4-diphosphocytidyl-2-C-methyl-D-erythritol kinase